MKRLLLIVALIPATLALRRSTFELNAGAASKSFLPRASRRGAPAEADRDGRVTVNGRMVTELGSKADPDTDDIRVDERRVKGPQQHRYLLLNKPRGYVTTRSDRSGGRPCSTCCRVFCERLPCRTAVTSIPKDC
jgi:hypothetical protein